MMPRSYDDAQEQFIKANCEDMTIEELMCAVRLPTGIIRAIINKHGLTYKRRKVAWKMAPKEHRAKIIIPDPPKVPIVRAKAEYSNSGYEEVKRKYL